MPVFGAALAVPVLGETPTISQVVGGVLVLVGILVVERRHEATARAATAE